MMDDIKRDMLYAAALNSTADHRKKMLDFWVDAGMSPTEGESKEIESETETLKMIAGRAVNLAKIALDAADNYIEIDMMVDEANARGYELVRMEDEDEEDEEA